MITKTKAYSVGDKVYATLEAAQKAELEALFKEISEDVTYDPVGTHEFDITSLCDAITRRKDRFMDILGTTETSRPRARKVNRVKPKKISASEILDQAAADGIRRQNAKLVMVTNPDLALK